MMRGNRDNIIYVGCRAYSYKVKQNLGQSRSKENYGHEGQIEHRADEVKRIEDSQGRKNLGQKRSNKIYNWQGQIGLWTVKVKRI